LRRHRPSLGAAVAEHAHAGHHARLSWWLFVRGHEPLGGPRHHASLRARGRALYPRARAIRGHGSPERRPWGDAEALLLSPHVSKAWRHAVRWLAASRHGSRSLPSPAGGGRDP